LVLEAYVNYVHCVEEPIRKNVLNLTILELLTNFTVQDIP